jgi:kinesin family member C2/C3
MEEQLTTKVKEEEYLLLQSNKKVEEVETTSRLKSQLWDKRTIFRVTWIMNNKLSMFVHYKDSF